MSSTDPFGPPDEEQLRAARLKKVPKVVLNYYATHDEDGNVLVVEEESDVPQVVRDYYKESA